MAAGLPVSASDVPACREVLADGAAGVLVPPSDVEAWACALQELMDQPAKRVELAKAALLRAKIYDIKLCAQRWYQELLR